MCWAQKCCYYIPLQKACIFLGFANLILSTCVTVGALVSYVAERNMTVVTKDHLHHMLLLFGLEWKVQTINIILSIVAIIGVFWMIFSVLLIVGVLKNEPNLILCFFSFGIILTILFMLSGLLMLISQFWWEALVIMILSMFNIHFLVVIHSFYDLMQKGNFSFQRQRDSDQDTLADCFDESYDV